MNCHALKCNILSCFSPKATVLKSHRKYLKMLAAEMWHITKNSGSLGKSLKDFLPGEQEGTDNTGKIFSLMKNKCVKEFKLTRKKEEEREGY